MICSVVGDPTNALNDPLCAIVIRTVLMPLMRPSAPAKTTFSHTAKVLESVMDIR
jgi:hypothetical protein